MLDVLFVNPPSPDGEVFIRDICRVGRRSREKMVWPQTALAQLAAMVADRCAVAILDCIAEEITWPRFQQYLEEKRPRFMVTHVTAPTLTNDMYGTFLAKAMGAETIAIGTHVTPLTGETMAAFPTLDYVIRGEPELTLRELIEARQEGRPLAEVKGLAFRHKGDIIINEDRPLIENLDELPLPLHHLLPLDKYRIPMIRGPYAFVLVNRGCPARCRFCIQRVMWKNKVRSRSPEHIIQELKLLHSLGVDNVHFEADLFTYDRERVLSLCQLILQEGLQTHWTCNSRVDMVDPEMLAWMKRAGCWMISWGIESGSQQVLNRARKGINLAQIEQGLRRAREAGIGNWGYFIIGLPGETEETVEETIRLARQLPLDLALFHIAVPYPGTDFYEEATEQGWLRMKRWEDFDMDEHTVLEYPHLSAEQLEKAARRAFRKWALRPGPALTYLRSANSLRTLKAFFSIGWQHLNWMWR
jgi:anaerobic magnesium-protoporphyrin IX monomethyl ester cyclase